jgi:simple sugar transport system permease protein
MINIVKRATLTREKEFRIRALSIFLALCAGGLFLARLKLNPFLIYATILTGAFKSAMAIQATVKILIPLLITSLAVTVAFKMRFWNIGAEGQIIMGAVFASYFALFHSDWPHAALILAALLAGAFGGGLWGLLPAWFKARRNANETLFTLMLNYIALNVVVFLRDGPWRDPSALGFPKIARFAPNATLDRVFGVQFGWIIAAFLTVVVHIYCKHSKHGYEIAVVGESKSTAEYAGMDVKKIILRTMFISGALAGICGAITALGSDATLATGVAGGVGFTAIIVAWLARLDPIGIFITSWLFAILEKGSGVMQSSYGVSSYSSDILQGIILFFVLGFEFFTQYKFKFNNLIFKDRARRTPYAD